MKDACAPLTQVDWLLVKLRVQQPDQGLSQESNTYDSGSVLYPCNLRQEKHGFLHLCVISWFESRRMKTRLSSANRTAASCSLVHTSNSCCTLDASSRERKQRPLLFSCLSHCRSWDVCVSSQTAAALPDLASWKQNQAWKGKFLSQHAKALPRPLQL